MPDLTETMLSYLKEAYLRRAFETINSSIEIEYYNAFHEILNKYNEIVEE